MRRLETRLDGLVHLEPDVHGDARGFFVESYRENVWAEHGIHGPVVQDNHSRSGHGVLRGMHFSIGDGQATPVRCARGRILDAVVDLRGAAPPYGEWEAVELDDEHGHQLYIPVGFAHGFCVLSDVADVTYKCSTYYDAAIERGFAYNDPDVGIEWPHDMALLVSERDMNAPDLHEIADDLPF